MQLHRRSTPFAPTGLLRLWAALSGLVLLAGCAPGSNLATIPPYNGTVYRLGVGDRLRVITYGEQQLTEEFRIGDGGNIAFPLLGNVKADGLTSTELGRQIESELRSHDLVRNPSVAVEVVSYREVSVLGEVAKPGQYPYQPGMTLLTAIAAAGGFTYRAVEDYAYVVRDIDAKTVSGKITPQDYVKPGDVIKVYERWF